MSSDERMYTPDEWVPPHDEPPHDHKGHSEEKCVRCGWVMGHRPLNCMNDDTPHVFPSQQAEIERLRNGMELAWGLIANGQYWDRTDGRRYGEWNDARLRWRDEHWHPALDRNREATRGH